MKRRRDVSVRDGIEAAAAGSRWRNERDGEKVGYLYGEEDNERPKKVVRWLWRSKGVGEKEGG